VIGGEGEEGDCVEMGGCSAYRAPHVRVWGYACSCQAWTEVTGMGGGDGGVDIGVIFKVFGLSYSAFKRRNRRIGELGIVGARGM
jgi:hypothetical protein